MMSKIKVTFLLFATVVVAAWFSGLRLSAQDNAQNAVSTEETAAEAVALPQTDTEGKDVIHGRVFTVPAGEDHYIPYGGVHGTFTQDGKIIAEFFTDEKGEFTIIDLPAGDWEVMAEQERDEVFGSSEVTVSYDVFHEETLVLFLNGCGLARFPNEFDPSLPIAENAVKYWQYVNCVGAGSKTPQNAGVCKNTASDAYAQACNTCSQCNYDPCGTCSSCGCQPCCNPLGALGLLGLLGLIGSVGPGPGPGPISRF